MSGSGNKPDGACPSNGLLATGGVCRGLCGEGPARFLGEMVDGFDEREGGAIGPKLLPGEMFLPDMLKSTSSFDESSFQGLVLLCY